MTLIMLGVLVIFVLCQQSPDPTRPAEAVQMLAQAREAAQSGRANKFGAQTKREFAERFNRLIDALKDFEVAYSSNQGEVWPHKQAAKLDLAMRELTNSPGWRKKE